MFYKIFDEIVARSKEALPPLETDIIIDGLRHCGICQKPRECRITPTGSKHTFILPVMCDCDKAEDAQFQQRQRHEEQMRTLNTLKSVSYDDPTMRSASFFAKGVEMNKAVRTAFHYLEHYDELAKDGKGMIFFGPTGVGKTFAVSCLVNALNETGVTAVLTSFTAISDWVTEDFRSKAEKIQLLLDADVLAIDDLGTERSSEFMQETIERIVDSRWRNKKPIIITTNLTTNDLKQTNNYQRGRVYSRLRSMCVPVVMTGDDRRASGDSSMDEAMMMLGV